MIHHKVIPEKYPTTNQYRSGNQFDGCLRVTLKWKIEGKMQDVIK
jgi:hypothetical protein